MTYTDLVGRLGEWQFARFGRYFPALTVLLPIVLGLIVWTAAAKILRVLAERRSGTRSALGKRRILLVDATRLLFILAAVAGLLTLAVFTHYLQLPDNRGKLQLVSLKTASAGDLREGPVKLIDAPGIGPVSRYADGLIFTQRTSFFMPVGAASTAREGVSGAEKPFNLFVEVAPSSDDISDDALARLVSVKSAEHRGLLRAGALPAEIVAMYRGAGYPVDTSSSVLFLSPASANFRVLLYMCETLAFGLIALLFGLILNRSKRRADRAEAVGSSA
ncbi:MAG: hypothetical protein U0S50_18045 [Sphingopyxis sp.]|uniref:hypothetical protein n=1 Tax=Sphingopyxis sp. TaxID=1908224 RepID=UPI002ABC0F68|nr:hypothetical protein [Sphingopyxis sp.]MDZ3833694.1 hypothetical protein [Sphingopyxis sp.]